MKTILTIILAILSFNLFAQTNMSSHRTDWGHWNSTTEEWDITRSISEATFFSFNEAVTLFTHTTSELTSSYIINSFKDDKSEGRDQIEMEVVSDVGNHYYLIYDIKNTNIRFINFNATPMTISKFVIKQVW